MKFYVVGFYKHGREDLYGDALVHAFNHSDALSRVRQIGLTPNPGDRYVVGGERYEETYDGPHIMAWMMSEAERRPHKVYVLWDSEEHFDTNSIFKPRE
ncbi:hypothetical protein LCGC14_1732340 [marine sediment metagenome]|uniref:Uncharacterized protein n=1 Tax=marine sediment metagenome TaxID=412755 RepID=A0A0F9K8V5_9ZZZZ